MAGESARAFCEAELMPGIVQANRSEAFDREILRRMGDNPRRADLAQAVLTMGDFDLGMGQPLSFGGAAGRRQASDHVYYTVVKDGRFVQLQDDEWRAWAKR